MSSLGSDGEQMGNEEVLNIDRTKQFLSRGGYSVIHKLKIHF